MGGVSLPFLKSLVQRSPSSHAYEKLPIGKDKPVETPQSSQPPIKESKDEVSFSSHRRDQTPAKQSMTPLQKLSNGFKSRLQALKNEFSPPPPERIHKETLNADGSKTTDYWNGKDYTRSITTHADGSKTSSFNEEKKFRKSKITTPNGTVQSQYGNNKSFNVLGARPVKGVEDLRASRFWNKLFPSPKERMYMEAPNGSDGSRIRYNYDGKHQKLTSIVRIEPPPPKKPEPTIVRIEPSNSSGGYHTVYLSDGTSHPGRD